jgi:hypothetical protein
MILQVDNLRARNGGNVMNSSEYNSAVLRVNKANTKEELNKLEKSLIRCYNAGVLNEKELSKLDEKIMHKLALLG